MDAFNPQDDEEAAYRNELARLARQGVRDAPMPTARYRGKVPLLKPPAQQQFDPSTLQQFLRAWEGLTRDDPRLYGPSIMSVRG